jgi:hypothetical protein
MRIVQADVEDAGLLSTDVSALIDLLVPPRCVGCDHPVTTL